MHYVIYNYHHHDENRRRRSACVIVLTYLTWKPNPVNVFSDIIISNTDWQHSDVESLINKNNTILTIKKRQNEEEKKKPQPKIVCIWWTTEDLYSKTQSRFFYRKIVDSIIECDITFFAKKIAQTFNVLRNDNNAYI